MIEKKFEFNQKTLSYLDSNNQTSDLSVIFLHGNSHSSHTFDNQFSYFNNMKVHQESFELIDFKLRLLALDFPGHGNSERFENYSMDLFVQSLFSFIDHLKLKNFIVVGHSFGGHVALQALATESFDPKGIFIFGSPPLTTPIDMSAFKSHPFLSYLFKAEVSEEEARSLLAAMYETHRVLDEEVKDFFRADSKFREQISLSFSNGSLKDEIKLFQEFKGIKKILACENDQFINLNYLRNKITKESLEYVFSTHNAHRESVKIFNNTLVSFVKSCHNLIQ